MKLAHILPLSLVDCTPMNQTVHLAISTLIADNPAYLEFLLAKKERGHTIILDNPVHEDEFFMPETWLNAIRRLQPTVAVLPDVIDDSDQTLYRAKALADAAISFGARKLMAVPHGIGQGDFFACALALAEVPGVEYLGISLERRFGDDEKALARRRERLDWVKRTEKLDSIKVHLLGSSERGHEFMPHEDWSRASSTDSSKFAVFALCGIPQLPPVPINARYPGRTALGGSMEYFRHERKFPTYGKWNLTRNLTLWINYAERDDRK